MTRLEGLIAAPATPLHDDGSIAPEVVPDYAAFLVREGVAGVFVNGSTGESLSLTRTERETLAEAWITAARATPLKVVIHVGCECLTDARALAAHAQAHGAAAVGAMPTIFFKANGLDALAAEMAFIAQACPNLPFYYYHMPERTGQPVPVHKLLPRIRALAPNTAGAKYTFENIMDYTLCLEAGFDVLFGRDEILLSALVMGARGAVGSTYNVFAPLFTALMEAHAAGRHAAARTLQIEAMRRIAVMAEGLPGVSFFAALKLMLTMQGIPCGPVRPPLTQPDAAALDHARQWIVKAGLLAPFTV